MKRLQLVALGLVFSTLAAEAQTLTTNDAGQQVIVYPDGTSRLFDDSTAVPLTATDSVRQVPIYRPVNSPRTLSADEEKDAKKYVERQLSVLKKEVKTLTKSAKDARKREAKLTNRVADLRNSRKIADRSQIEIVNQKLQATREEVTRTESDLARSVRQQEALARTVIMSQAERERELGRVGLAHLARENGASPAYAPGTNGASPGGEYPNSPAAEDDGWNNSASSTPESVATSSTGNKDQRKTPYAVYAFQNDPRYTPPVPTCRRELAGVDEFTQQRRVSLSPELLFAYTTPELRAYLGNESLISCYAQLKRLGSSIMLDAEFVIRSQFASKEFGVLPKGSQLTLRMVGGEKLVLRNNVQSQAQYDPVTKVSTYRGTYPISKGQAKFLKQVMLDQVRVMWGTGFDDYAIYDLSLLQRQINCL